MAGGLPRRPGGWLIGLLAAAGVVGLAGCGSGSDVTDEIDTSDSAQVGAAFIEAVANGRTAACQLMTEAGIAQLTAASQAEDCDQAIASLDDSSPVVFCVGRPRALLRGLPGAIVESPSGTQFKLTAPNGTSVKLWLVESDDGWRVDVIGWGQVDVSKGGSPDSDTCGAA